MSRKQYRSGSEGATYPKREIVTHAEMERIRKTPRMDHVATAQELAVDVLSHFYGEGVELVGRHEEPAINGEPLGWPRNGEHPEIVTDAFELLDIAHSVNTLGNCINDERFAADRPMITIELVGAAARLGRWTERVAVRWEGVEHRARLGKHKEDFAASQSKLHFRRTDVTCELM